MSVNSIDSAEKNSYCQTDNTRTDIDKLVEVIERYGDDISVIEDVMYDEVLRGFFLAQVCNKLKGEYVDYSEIGIVFVNQAVKYAEEHTDLVEDR